MLENIGRNTLVRQSTPPRTSPPLWYQPSVPKSNFPRGAIPSPRHKLSALEPYKVTTAPPPGFAVVPSKLDVWGNSTYGDCVSAEEGFKLACNSPEIFVSADVVINWARKGGFLNGADLSEVMDAMAKGGFQVGSQQYNDGPHQVIDYSNVTTLASAISEAPVKIAIDANALPSGAGNQQGWFKIGGRKGQYGNTDHCVGLSGQGTAEYLFQQLGVPLPSGLTASAIGFLLFTWATIGFVDMDWIMSTVAEAHIRIPATIGVPPLPPPVPVTPPDVIDW